MEKINLISVFTGMEMVVNHYHVILEENDIAAMIKSEFDSGIRAGFGSGLIGSSTLWVNSTNYDAACQIIRDLENS